MRVLVTGCSGFVGRNLLSKLTACGVECIGVSRRAYDGVPSGVVRATRDAFLKEHPVQIPDCVIHLEVKQHISAPTEQDIIDFRRVNVEGTVEWLNFCARYNVPRFFYFSSIKAVRPAVAGPTDEEALGPGDSAYGASKWEAELAVRAWVQAGSDRTGVIVRPAVIYGAGSAGNLVAMREAIRRGRFFLVGRNENIKSVVSIENVTAAIWHLLKRVQGAGVEVYNLADAEALTVREIDRRLRALMGLTGSSPEVPFAVAQVAAKVGDGFCRITGRPFPISTPRLTALTEQTHFTSTKLASTGFEWRVPTLWGVCS